MEISELRRLSSEKTLMLLYSLGVAGAFLQIAGANWDVSAHILGIVETFFTPAHSVLYTGIVLVAFANLIGLRLRRKIGDNPSYAPLLTGVRIATVGSVLQFIAAPFDFWWHSTYGFDPFLFTPAHSILIIGMILGGLGMTLGSIRLLQGQRSGFQITTSARSLTAVVVVALAAIWGQMNFFSYWITDVYGMAYTFGSCSVQQLRAGTPCSFVDQFSTPAFLVVFALFAASGTLVFWTSKALFTKRGMITSTAVLISAVYSAAAFGFTAYALEFLNPPGTWYLRIPSHQIATQLSAQFASSIPIYLLFLIPVLLLDVSIKNPPNKRKLILTSALVGPFIAFLDRFAQGIWRQDILSLALVVGVMVIGGVLGGLLLTRLSKRILPSVITSEAKFTKPMKPQ
jgi:hypothetical protein